MMASADLKEELNCSICLEVYKDPVTLRCGHNFCRVCIDRVLDSQRGHGVFACPECRAVFKRRPWLQKNVTLSNIAERFHPTSPDQKKVEVSCTYCIQTAVPAVQCCLLCEASLCKSHLNVHSKSPEHVLIEPTTSPGKWKCSIHNKILQYYCTVDSTCICMSCLQDVSHRGHHVQTLGDASKNKKDKLKKILTQLTSKRQEHEKSLKGLQEKRKKADDAATTLTTRANSLFQHIRQRLDILEAQTVGHITKQADMNVKPLSDLIQQLEVKQEELYSTMCYAEDLCSVTDPLTVLQEKELAKGDFYVTEKGGRQDAPKIAKIDEILIFLNLHKDLSDILNNVSEVLKLPGISELQYDEDTAASNVTISPDLLIAQGTEDNNDDDDSNDDDYDEDDDDDDEIDNSFESHQVISKTGLSWGRHYWQVELCDTSNNWRIGMSYSSIDRDGEHSVFGNTDESWCLCKSMKSYSFRHNGNRVSLPSSFKRFKRLGIYLDFDEGRLSFYNLEQEVRHLHTFYHSFQEPLHAAVRVGYGVWVKIVN